MFGYMPRRRCCFSFLSIPNGKPATVEAVATTAPIHHVCMCYCACYVYAALQKNGIYMQTKWTPRKKRDAEEKMYGVAGSWVFFFGTMTLAKPRDRDRERKMLAACNTKKYFAATFMVMRMLAIDMHRICVWTRLCIFILGKFYFR